MRQVTLDIGGEQLGGRAPAALRAAEAKKLGDPALVTRDGGSGQTPAQADIADALKEFHGIPNIYRTPNLNQEEIIELFACPKRCSFRS
jgi:hypothetical protein